MTLQQMEYIVALDNYRHFVKAAEACGITQSTLSSMIQKLELELGVTLFDRKAHPLKPTEVGEEVIRQAKVVLYNTSQLQELVVSKKGEATGELRLGIASTIAPYILPKLFKFLSKHHPGIHLFVEEARVDDLTAKLERAELDVALMATPVVGEELLEIPLFKEKFFAYVSPKESMYHDKTIETMTLTSENVWVLRESYCPRSGALPFCQCNTCRNAVYEAGSIETLLKVVDENGGYSIIPELHVPLLCEEQKNNVRPLQNPEPARIVAFIIRQDFVRERMLNILLDAVKSIVPREMIHPRLHKFPIKL
ncbi:MAG: LysR family transcriptional regulator [Bacteroidales bacterium]|nr:LysR family transcriptional regulator [Bacteroidales bacterium]